MGADLICFIAKGPVKVNKRSQMKAVKRATKIIELAKELVRVAKKFDREEDLTDAEAKLYNDGILDPLLSGFQDQEQYSSLDEAVENLETLAGFEPNTEVSEFVRYWLTNAARDTNSRIDPDDNKQKIVVCGELSWGDAPEGEGYLKMRYGYWLDIPQSLGIR